MERYVQAPRSAQINSSSQARRTEPAEPLPRTFFLTDLFCGHWTQTLGLGISTGLFNGTLHGTLGERTVAFP